MNKIVLIYQDDYPWDIRIEKFLHSISKYYKVHLLCRNKKKMISDEQAKENVFIHRMNPDIKNAYTSPFHFNPVWKKFISSNIEKIKPDLLIVRNLPLAKLAINTGRKYNIPVIFDNAENYPEYFTTHPKYRKNTVMQILYRLGYPQYLEKYCIRNSSYVINVIEENTERLKLFNRNMTEVYNVPYVSNKPPVHRELHPDKIKICYSGGLETNYLRGVCDIIKAMKLLDKHYELHIFGDGEEKDNLINLSKELKVDDRCYFHGRVDYNILLEQLRNFDIGVVSHRKIKMTDTTMANKVYEYISYGLIVISTNAKPLERFVTENKVGLVYESGNAEDLADKIKESIDLKMNSNDERLYRYEIYKNKFNWDIEEKKLIEIIQKQLLKR